MLRILRHLKCCGSHVRTLYTVEALGVDKYLYSKEKISSQFVNSADKFKEKMQVRLPAHVHPDIRFIFNPLPGVLAVPRAHDLH